MPCISVDVRDCRSKDELSFLKVMFRLGRGKIGRRGSGLVLCACVSCCDGDMFVWRCGKMLWRTARYRPLAFSTMGTTVLLMSRRGRKSPRDCKSLARYLASVGTVLFQSANAAFETTNTCNTTPRSPQGLYDQNNESQRRSGVNRERLSALEWTWK